MYLTEVSTWDMVKKLYRYKLNSYFGVFTSLVIIQILSILFSLNGTGSSGGSSDTFEYNMNIYSGTLILAFMMGWAFLVATLITTKAYRYDDSSFVSNRTASHFSNILFLFSASIIAGITVYFSYHLFLSVVSLFMKVRVVQADTLTPIQLAQGITASVLYIFLFTSLGYLTGMLVQVQKFFVFVLPALFIGALIIDGNLSDEPRLLISLGSFYGLETSFIVFVFKTLLTTGALYGVSILVSRRVEVRP
ncbi:hypothetical protein SAMN04488137_3869 [Fictibacillus solisalsi]|uniref:ABC-2 family transporter protein n=1 Tax=Fictibacillus solisalsi TaxID=459525 RepID=A0A1H0A0G8_9BACL|nr:hypothetical protein [Fictibacillus solisalsi]SDN27312.1 hypothetical protein SAMN04488137_3869 [Fictibacillus solisalsi]